MVTKKSSTTRIQWLEQRLTRRKALRTGAAGTFVAATTLWATPLMRTVSASGTLGGTPPPAVCTQRYEYFDYTETGPITYLPFIKSVSTKRRDGVDWNQVDHPALLFDTANPTGGDWDMLTPAISPGPNPGDDGYGNTVAQHKVLIVQEHGPDSNGAYTPDDNGTGGLLIFEFSCPMRVDNIDFLDIDNGGSEIILETPTGNQTLAIPVTGNGSWQRYDLGFENVVKLTVKIYASGAVSRICFCHPEDCLEYQPGQEPLST